MRTLEISIVAYWKKLVMKFSGGDIHQGEHDVNKDLHTLYSFSFVQVFIPLGFSWQGFNEAVLGEHGVNEDLYTLYSFSFVQVFIPLGFPGKVLTRQCRTRLTLRSRVNYDIQKDDQQYGLRIFCQTSGGACYQ